jgi:hypothetical protein
MPLFVQYSLQLPEADRAAFLEKQLMQMKCMNFFKVSMNECRIWQEKNEGE